MLSTNSFFTQKPQGIEKLKSTTHSTSRNKSIETIEMEKDESLLNSSFINTSIDNLNPNKELTLKSNNNSKDNRRKKTTEKPPKSLRGRLNEFRKTFFPGGKKKNQYMKETTADNEINENISNDKTEKKSIHNENKDITKDRRDLIEKIIKERPNYNIPF